MTSSNTADLRQSTPVIKLSPNSPPKQFPEDMTLEMYRRTHPVTKPPTVITRNQKHITLERTNITPEQVFIGHTTGNYYVEGRDAATNTPVVEAVSPVKQEYAAPPVVKVINDFSLLGLTFLNEKTEPSHRLTFCTDWGDYDSYYHKIIPSSSAIYLLKDNRCKSVGGFKPKSNNQPLNIKIDNKSYSGYLWSEGQFNLGCLEITPFILSHEVEVEEETPDNNVLQIDNAIPIEEANDVISDWVTQENQ
jgi:hypothetical protein